MIQWPKQVAQLCLPSRGKKVQLRQIRGKKMDMKLLEVLKWSIKDIVRQFLSILTEQSDSVL